MANPRKYIPAKINTSKVLSIRKSINWKIRVSWYFLPADASSFSEECSISIDHKVSVPGRPILIEKCLIYQHWHPALQLLMRNGYIQCWNKGLDWCYLWIIEAIHFLQQFRAVFQNPYFIDTCATVYDYVRFDNFPLMADKIRVRSKDKGFVVQSNDEAMGLYGDWWSFGVQ